jgi:ParB/RepB/Spo0J family partition protein
MEQYSHLSIPLSEIKTEYPGFTNCRTSVGDLTEIKKSIEVNGLLTAPMVWQTEDAEGKELFLLIAGHRRLHAIKELIDEVDGFDEMYQEINCTVYQGDLDGALTMNVAENVQREDLNPADAADAVGRLMERIGNQEKVGQVLGKSQSWVSGHLALHRQLCPQAKDALRKELITLKQARELAVLSKKGVPNVDAQVAALNKMLGRGETEKKDTKKKEATNRTKTDIMLLRKALVTDDELDIEESHRDSLLTLIRWFLLELSDEEVLERVELDNDYKLSVEDEEVEVAKPRSAGRPKLSEEEKVERENEKLALKVAQKEKKDAEKQTAKAEASRKKEAEKATKQAEKQRKVEEAAEKAAQKKAEVAKRAKKDLGDDTEEEEEVVKTPVRRIVTSAGKKLPK